MKGRLVGVVGDRDGIMGFVWGRNGNGGSAVGLVRGSEQSG